MGDDAKPRYPRGKLRADDKGRLAIKFAIQDNTLLMIFGKPIDWIGFGLDEVTALRQAFEKYEQQLKESQS